MESSFSHCSGMGSSVKHLGVQTYRVWTETVDSKRHIMLRNKSHIFSWLL